MASSRSSGLKTTDTAIATGRNRINAITLLADGVNAANVIIYDNASSASGTVLAKVKIATGSVIQHVIFENPVITEEGIFADVTGTGAEYIVYFGG